MANRHRERDPGGSREQIHSGTAEDPHQSSTSGGTNGIDHHSSQSSGENTSSAGREKKNHTSPSGKQIREDDSTTPDGSTKTPTSVFEASRTREPLDLTPSTSRQLSSTAMLHSSSLQSSARGAEKKHRHSKPSSSSAKRSPISSPHALASSTQLEKPPFSSRSVDPHQEMERVYEPHARDSLNRYHRSDGSGNGQTHRNRRRRKVLLDPGEEVKESKAHGMEKENAGREDAEKANSRREKLTSAQLSRLIEKDLTSEDDSKDGKEGTEHPPNSSHPPESTNGRRRLKSRSSGARYPAAEPLLPFHFQSSHLTDQFFVRYIDAPTNLSASVGLYDGSIVEGSNQPHHPHSSLFPSSFPSHTLQQGGGSANFIPQPLNEEEMMLEQFAEFTDDDSFFSSGSSVLSTDPDRMDVQRGPLYSHAVRSVKDSLMVQSLMPTNTYGGEEDWAQKSSDSEWLFQVHHRALCLVHSSFFIFPAEWTPRVVVYNILHHWVTELFLFVSILAYFIFQACWERNSPSVLFDVSLTRPTYMYFGDVFFTILLAFEILLRLFSYGLLLHPRSFLRSPWHWLDLAVFILMCMTCSDWPAMWNYTGWRLLRVLKCCRYFPAPVQLKILALSLLSSTTRLIGVTLYFIFFIFLFSLLGLHLFKDVLRYRCVDDTSLVVTSQICSPRATGKYLFYWGHECSVGQTCQYSSTYNPHFGFRSFDDIGHALLATFQIVTIQGWTSLLTETNDGLNTLAFLFYMFAIFICTWIIPALYCGVFVERWQVVQRRFLHKQVKKYDDILNEQRQRQQASVKMDDFVTRDAQGQVTHFPVYENNELIEKKVQEKLHKPIREMQWTDAHRVQLHLALTRNASLTNRKDNKSEGGMLSIATKLERNKEEMGNDTLSGQEETHRLEEMGRAHRSRQESAFFELGGRVGDVQHHPHSFGVGSAEGTQQDFATRQEAALSPFTFLSIDEEKERNKSKALEVAMAGASYGNDCQHQAYQSLQGGSATKLFHSSEGLCGSSRIERGQLLRPKVMQIREIAGVHPNHSAHIDGGNHLPGSSGSCPVLTASEESMLLTRGCSLENSQDGTQELLIHDPEGGALKFAPKWTQRWSIIRNMVHMVLEGYPRIITKYLWSYTWMIRQYGLLPLHYTNQYESEVMGILRRRRWEKLRDLQSRRGRRPLPQYMEAADANEEENSKENVELDVDEQAGDEIETEMVLDGPGGMARQISEFTHPTVFNIIMYVIMFANVCANACRFFDMPNSWENGLFIISVVFSCLFFLELMLHLIALGFGAFLYHGFYPVELLFVLLSFGQLGVDRSNAISLFNCIRFLRLLRISPIAPMRQSTSVLLIAFPSVLIALFFLTVYLFMWVLIGMSLFGGRFALLGSGDYSTPGSFSNFPYAVYAVMQAFSIDRDQWLYLSWSGMRAHGGYTILYFILTVFTAVIFRFLFIAIFTVTWMQYYRRMTNRAFDALHGMKGNLSVLQGRLRQRRRAPWFDFSVWRSFKHIHGGFHRRHIAPDQIFYLHPDMLDYLRSAESRKRAIFQKQGNKDQKTSHSHSRGGNYSSSSTTTTEGAVPVVLYHDGGEKRGNSAESDVDEPKMSTISGLPPSTQGHKAWPTEGHVQPNTVSPLPIIAVRALSIDGTTPRGSSVKKSCPICPYYPAGIKDVALSSDPNRFRHLYDDNGELFIIPNPCHADRHSLFPQREFWPPSSSRSIIEGINVSALNSGDRGEISLIRPITAGVATPISSAVPRLPLSDSGISRNPMDDSQQMSVTPISKPPGSAYRNERGGHGSPKVRSMAQRFPFAPSIPVQFHTLREEDERKRNNLGDIATSLGETPPKAYSKDGNALLLTSVPTHLLLPGPQMSPYYKVLDEFNTCLDLCRECNTFKVQPLPHARGVAGRTAEELHFEHCHMASVRSAKQTILHALLGFVEAQVAHGVKPTREMMQVVLGQAWSCGLLLFETLEHIMEEADTSMSRGGDTSWNILLDALQLQKWLTGLQVGEEQVGRSALAYLLAHQAKHDQEIAVRHYQAPFKAAERPNSMWNNDSAFFFLTPDNPLRKFVASIVHSLWFEVAVLFIICAAAICLAVYTPGDGNADMGGSHNSTKYDVLHGFDDAFVVLFILELLLRWISDGVVLPVRRAYFWHLWNIFDCFIVIISLLSWIDEDINLRYLKVFRCFRIIGLMRRCKVKSLSSLAYSIWTSIPLLANICFLLLCHCVIWAILYVSMFSQKMSMCSNPSIQVRKACESQGFEWVGAYDRSFTNFYESLLTTFELSTGAEWMNVMYQAVASHSVYQSPIPNKHPYLGLVFIPYYYLSHYGLFALLFGAIVMWYNRTRSALEGIEETASPPLARWQRIQAMSSTFSPRTQLLPFSNTISRALHSLVQHWGFELFMSIVIWLNAFFLCFEWSGMPQSQTNAIDSLQYLFVGCFTLEIIVRFSAHGLRDFKRAGFCWDVLVTILSFVQIILNTTTHHNMPFNVNILRLLRVGRVFYVFCFFNVLRSYAIVLYVTVASAFWDLISVGIFYALSVLIFAIVGLHFVGYIVPYSLDSAINMPYNNFNTLVNSMVMVFRLSTLDNWVSMLRGSMYTSERCSVAEAEGVRCALSNWAPVYYIALFLCCFVLAGGLFIAVVLYHYMATSSLFRGTSMWQHLFDLRDAWEKYDPNATGVLPADVLPHVLEKLCPPFGIHHRMHRVPLLRVLRAYHIPVTQSGAVQYRDVWHAVARRMAAITIVEQEIDGSKREDYNWDESWQRMEVELSIFDEEAHVRGGRSSKGRPLGDEQHLALLKEIPDGKLFNSFKPLNRIGESSGGTDFYCEEFFAASYLQACYRRNCGIKIAILARQNLWRHSRQACDDGNRPYSQFGFSRYSLAGPLPLSVSHRGMESSSSLGREEDTKSGSRQHFPPEVSRRGISGSASADVLPVDAHSTVEDDAVTVPTYCPVLPQLYQSAIIPSTVKRFGPDAEGAIKRGERRSDKLAKDAQKKLMKRSFNTPRRNSAALSSGEQTSFSFIDTPSHHLEDEGREYLQNDDHVSSSLPARHGKTVYQPPLGTDLELLRTEELRRRSRLQKR